MRKHNVRNNDEHKNIRTGPCTNINTTITHNSNAGTPT